MMSLTLRSTEYGVRWSGSDSNFSWHHKYEYEYLMSYEYELTIFDQVKGPDPSDAKLHPRY